MTRRSAFHRPPTRSRRTRHPCGPCRLRASPLFASPTKGDSHMQGRTRFAAIAVLLTLTAFAAALVPAGARPAAKTPAKFDLEGHRGTRGLRPENTLPAFGKALQVGVTTLELDTGVTKDGVVVVSHERRISPLECQDTGGNHFVGQLIKDLTYAQINTLDCGTRNNPNPATEPFIVKQAAVPGENIPRLAQ